MAEQEVSGVRETAGLVVPPTPANQVEEVTNAKPVEVVSDEPTPPGDALKAELADLRAKYERDLSNLRSTLDRRYSSDQQQWQRENSELKERLNELLYASLDDEDRGEYELELLRDENERLAQQVRHEAYMREQQEAMSQTAKMFNEFGVPYDKFDWSSPENFYQSAWGGLKDQMQSLRSKVSELEKKVSAPPPEQQPEQPPQSVTPIRKPAPQAFTGKGSPPSTQDILVTVQKGLSEKLGRDVTFEETFQAIESGKVDINALLRSRTGG